METGLLEIDRVEKGLLIMVRIQCLGESTTTTEAVMPTTAEIATVISDTLSIG